MFKLRIPGGKFKVIFAEMLRLCDKAKEMLALCISMNVTLPSKLDVLAEVTIFKEDNMLLGDERSKFEQVKVTVVPT